MEPIYQENFEITSVYVDRNGRLKPSMILYFAQEVAGKHSTEMTLGYEALRQRHLFWAVTRHRVQITRMPTLGETIRIETWPMPTTRVAYPRSMVAYDSQGRECFRSISLWVLMNLDTRNMILPGKSGISVVGTVRGNELESPTGLIARPLGSRRERTVCFTDLDRNGHMNNTRYLDWIDDLLPSLFHAQHTAKEFTICYLSEAREGQQLRMQWDLMEDGSLLVDGYRSSEEEKDHRVFSCKILFG